MAKENMAVIVRDGCVQSVNNIPNAITRIEVWDYDIFCTDQTKHEYDDDGKPFIRHFFRRKD